MFSKLHTVQKMRCKKGSIIKKRLDKNDNFKGKIQVSSFGTSLKTDTLTNN